LKRLALVILIAGLAAGAAVYLLAEEPEATSYVIVGDTAYPVDPSTSKAYRRQLERYGGKAALLFDDISRWIAARFQGKQLGVTIAAASAAAALIVFALAERRE
jgi:hypothetical protein